MILIRWFRLIESILIHAYWFDWFWCFLFFGIESGIMPSIDLDVVFFRDSTSGSILLGIDPYCDFIMFFV